MPLSQLNAAVLAVLAVATLCPTAMATDAIRDKHAREDARVQKRAVAMANADLHRIRASNAATLIPGAASRPLVARSESGYHGAMFSVGVDLLPGAPGELHVSTYLETQSYSFMVLASGGLDDRLMITHQPNRVDLVTAVTNVVAQERKAAAAAEIALANADAVLPLGKLSWKDAMTAATYDARLPQSEWAGSPSWRFLFGAKCPSGAGLASVALDENLQLKSLSVCDQ